MVMTNRLWYFADVIKRLIPNRIRWKGPFILSHLVTGHCNCKCESCLWRNNSSRDLTLDEIKGLYRDARELGFIINFIWGGEPLIRTDLPDILRFSKEMGFVNVVNTNGWFLEERLDDIGPSVDSLIISLDHPSEEHDRIRGQKGLFSRLLEGVRLTRKKYTGIKVMLNCLLMNINKEAIEDSVRLSRELGVSFYLCPIEVDLLRSGGMGDAKGNLKPGREEAASVAEALIGLKKRGFKVNNSYLYLESLKNGKRPYHCHFPKMVLQVGPEGEVIDCRAWDRPIGWIRKQSLKEIYHHERLRALGGPEGEGCNKCNNPNRIDMSYFWELRREPLASVFRMFLDR
jgi:MoaA/NifB/PqqE/SkfB family radical SAM enzyme